MLQQNMYYTLFELVQGIVAILRSLISSDLEFNIIN